MTGTRKVLLLAMVLFISSCASKPEEIAAIYYPDEAYSSFSCKELALERTRIEDQVLSATGRQREKRDNDHAWGWVGALLFFPTLFLIDGNDENTTHLAQLKGRYEAIQRVANAKRCAAGSNK